MGISFSKQKKLPIETIVTYEKTHNIKEIVKRYEFIKQTKQIYNVETILEIVENTDWDKIDLECTPIPSAPVIPITIPIAIPIN